MKNLIGLMLLFIVNGIALFGNVIHIPGDYPTIQEGINHADENDTILVSEGTYYENIHFRGKNVVLASEYILDENLEHIFKTIIDGGQPEYEDSASCIMLLSEEDSSAAVIGFTLQNGSGSRVNIGGFWREGGGIVMINSSAQIKHNLIMNNTAQGGGGGGISSVNGNSTIVNNMIYHNHSSYAGSIVLNWSGGTIRNNVIYMNSGGNIASAALMVWDAAGNGKPQIIENNTIVANNSDRAPGGIILHADAHAIIRNNIIWGNTQPGGNDQISPNNGSCIIENNTIEGYTTDDPDNFSLSPYFKPDTAFYLSDSSECIDAGKDGEEYADVEDPLNAGFALSPSKGSVQNDLGAFGGPLVSFIPAVTVENILVTEEIKFSKVKTGDSKNKSFYISNQSAHPVMIEQLILEDRTNLILTDSEDNILTPDTNMFTKQILTTSSAYFNLQWEPTNEGELNTRLLIYHNAEKVPNPLFISITGTAENPEVISSSESLNMKHEYRFLFNPIQKTIHIGHLIRNETGSVQIIDMQGRVTGNKKIEKSSIIDDITLDISDLPKGIYIVRVIQNSYSASEKIFNN